MLLEIKDLRIHYDKVEAVKGVSLGVDKGEVITLIGANGAGKTSILKAISGLVRPSEGEIWYDAQRIDRAPPHRVVELGIAHVPEGRRLFRLMTVHDNLRLGAYLQKDKRQLRESFERVYRHFPVLRERQGQAAKNLSGGQQQMVALARALMAEPKLIVMDEPSLGLAPIMIEEIAKIIRSLKASGLSIVLVEQNAALALELADRAYVLETGTISLQGASQDLLDNPHVVKAYLGA